MGAVNAIVEREQQDVNVRSVTTAHLASLVVSAFGGDSKQISINDFLPFNSHSQNAKSLDDLAKEPSSETKGVIQKLIKEGRLPPKAIAMLSKNI